MVDDAVVTEGKLRDDGRIPPVLAATVLVPHTTPTVPTPPSVLQLEVQFVVIAKHIGPRWIVTGAPIRGW
jgi:hypothetical protein